MNDTATRYNRSLPCPVCGTGTKGCSVTTDGFQRCRGDHAATGWVLLHTGETWKGYRHEDDLDRNGTRGHWLGRTAGDRRGRSSAGGASPSKPKKASAQPPEYWQALAEQYAANLTPALKSELADILRIPVAALDTLPLLGYIPGKPILLDGEPTNDGQWAFPERDAAGNVVGIKRRWREGCGGETDKRHMKGGATGLTIPRDWREGTGPLFAFEGASDTITVASAGGACVGRPSNEDGADDLAELLRDWPLDRPIVIVGENDEKADGDWPGKRGAVKTANAVAKKLRHTVFYAMIPEGAKDARDWMTADARGSMPWAGRWAELSERLVESATACESVPIVPIGDSSKVPADPRVSRLCQPPVPNLDRVSPNLDRVSCPNAENTAIEQLTRSRPARTDNFPDELNTLIGKAPRYRPCRYCQHRPREGCHPATAGTFDIIKTTCGKCHPCQEKIRHRDKRRHASAAFQSATHTWNGSEDDWRALIEKLNRIRKKVGRRTPYGYCRIVRPDGTRVTLFSIDCDESLLAGMDMIPIASADAAKLVCRVIDGIPYKLPKGTKRIISNATWKAASLVPPEKRAKDEEELYTDLGPVPLAGGDMQWAEDAATDEGAEVVHAPLRHFRVEDRIIVRPLPETEDEVFRKLFGVSLTRLRREAKERREAARLRRQERREQDKFWREWGRICDNTRRYWKGREHEATGLLAEWLKW